MAKAKSASTSQGIRIVIEGDKKLQRGLRDGIKILQQTEVPQKKAANLAANRARQLAPKKTGRLANSIAAGPDGSISSPLVYAPVIHWGWRERRIPENWFILNAARETEYKWLDFFEDFMDEAVDAV